MKDPLRPRPFRVPGGLIIPILGIISCLYLIYYLPPTSWLRFAAWLSFGFVIYVVYGSVNSRLTGRETADNPAGHDAQTAYLGSLLGVIGTVLLFLMRGFDLWLESRVPAADDPAGPDLATANPWLALSWFLVAPLAVNAVILFPTIIARALRAKGAGLSGRSASTADASILITGVLSIATIAYLVAVFLHNR